jgi:hypothetical protein
LGRHFLLFYREFSLLDREVVILCLFDASNQIPGLGQKAKRNEEKEGKKDFHRIGKIKGNQSTRRKKNGKRCED